MRTALCFIIVGATILLGCAQPQTIWVKQGGTKQDFDKDYSECLARAEGHAFFPAIPSAIEIDTTDRKIVTACLKAHGWNPEKWEQKQ